MAKEFRRGIAFTLVTMVLFGGAYHLLIWGIGRLVFPRQAEGSLIRRPDGSVAGSTLIAQPFTKAWYFHPRPSAVHYDAASTGGSNFGPSNPDHLQRVKERLGAVTTAEGVPITSVPSEMVTASGSGLDPHIPPAAAELQLPRVARARGVTEERVRALVRTHTQPPTLGFLGRDRVSVLTLNLALDRDLGTVHE